MKKLIALTAVSLILWLGFYANADCAPLSSLGSSFHYATTTTTYPNNFNYNYNYDNYDYDYDYDHDYKYNYDRDSDDREKAKKYKTTKKYTTTKAINTVDFDKAAGTKNKKYYTVTSSTNLNNNNYTVDASKTISRAVTYYYYADGSYVAQDAPIPPLNAVVYIPKKTSKRN